MVDPVARVRVRRRWVFLAAPLLLVPTLTAAQEQPAPHAVLIQESNGFPGGERGDARLSRQKVMVQGDRLAVVDQQHMWALFVDLAEKKVREADVAGREYVERDFGYYAKYREQRAKNLQDMRDEFLRQRERVEDEPADLRRLIDGYRRAGGDPDRPGEIVARLQHFPQDQRKAALLVDGAEREVTLEHYVIRENQADVPVFDLWVTSDVKLPVDLYRFYGELGTFSQPVSDKLIELRQRVDGMVVEARVMLDTGTFNRSFQSKVLDVRTQEAPAGLQVPEGWKKVDPDAKKPAVEASAAFTCEQCGKEISGEPHVFREPWGARSTHRACSAECRRALIKRLAEARQK